MAQKKNNQARKRMKIETKKAKNDQNDDLNPFELRFNKVKHNVLGRKRQKNEFGKPFISRNRAYQKREQTLLQEYKTKNKTPNGLRDLRESDAEQRAIAQYKERQERINLDTNDAIGLTHKGRPLDELMDDHVSSDEEDLDLFNRDDYVETSHFGGGGDGPPRSKKEILEEILAEKSQRKLEKEETFQLTEKLDSQWSEVSNLVRYKNSSQDDGTNSKQPEEYDNLLKQLLFDDKNNPREKQPLPAPKKMTDIEPGLQTPDALIKTKLTLIKGSKDIGNIVKTIKEIIDLLPQSTKKSFIHLKECLMELAETKLKFTPKEIGLLIVAAYFKEFQVLIHLIVLRTLNKIKYSSLKEIACSIFLINFILETISAEKFCPELFVHLENLIGLLNEKTKIKLFHRLDYETEGLLNVSRWKNELKPDAKYSVTLTNLFGGIFQEEETDPETIGFNLAVQIFELLNRVHQKYSSSNTIRYMLTPSVNLIRKILQKEIPNSTIKTAMKDFLEKFDTKTSKSVVICTDRPRPVILPLLEPKLEENQNFMKSKLPERKKLQKKYKREFKGAQREIRKDSTFLRDAYLKEVTKKDNIRKKKVKEILRDLSIQQGLYKKKK